MTKTNTLVLVTKYNRISLSSLRYSKQLDTRYDIISNNLSTPRNCYKIITSDHSQTKSWSAPKPRLVRLSPRFTSTCVDELVAVTSHSGHSMPPHFPVPGIVINT